jgi:predicted GIY-YIG superfamily endonuclease
MDYVYPTASQMHGTLYLGVDDPTNDIAREKGIKKWRRDRKIRLIEEENQN